MDNQLFGDVDNYIINLLAQEDDILRTVINNIKDAGVPMINISPSQGKLLQVLARMCNAKNILEVGTLVGYSTLWLARALPDNGRVVTIEVDPEYAALAQKNFELASLDKKIKIRVGKALNILPEIVAKNEMPYDLIFIDADKPPYVEYFNYAIQLSRPGTIIVADNVIREGKVLDANSSDEKVQGVRRLNQFLSDCDKVTSIILPTMGVKEYDGMAIAVVN